MQNLFLKLVVLTAVIGGSCIVVWRANEELQRKTARDDLDEFKHLEVDDQSDDSGDDSKQKELAAAEDPLDQWLKSTEESGPLTATDEIDRHGSAVPSSEWAHLAEHDLDHKEITPAPGANLEQPREFDFSQFASTRTPTSSEQSPGQSEDAPPPWEFTDLTAKPTSQPGMPLEPVPASDNQNPEVQTASLERPATPRVRNEFPLYFAGGQDEEESTSPSVAQLDQAAPGGQAESTAPGGQLEAANEPSKLPDNEDQFRGMPFLALPDQNVVQHQAGDAQRPDTPREPNVPGALPVQNEASQSGLTRRSRPFGPSHASGEIEQAAAELTPKPATAPTQADSGAILRLSAESYEELPQLEPAQPDPSPDVLPPPSQESELSEPTPLSAPVQDEQPWGMGSFDSAAAEPEPIPANPQARELEYEQIPGLGNDPFGGSDPISDNRVQPAGFADQAGETDNQQRANPAAPLEPPPLPPTDSSTTLPLPPAELPELSTLPGLEDDGLALPPESMTIRPQGSPTPAYEELPSNGESMPTIVPATGQQSMQTVPKELPSFDSRIPELPPAQSEPSLAEPSRSPAWNFDRLPNEEPASTRASSGPLPLPGLDEGPTPASTQAATPQQPAQIRPLEQFPAQSGRPNPAQPTDDIPTREQLLGTAELDHSAPEGPQSPELKIEKVAPEEAVIGEPLIYSIIVRNVGGSEARDVVVEDRIPRGAQLQGTIPQAFLADGKLSWQLGNLAPGAERKVQLKVVPLESGQIGSVATVSFAAAVSTKIRVTAPKMSLHVDHPQEVVVGERLPFQFTLRNDGEGTARNVFLRTILPAGLNHPGGSDIEYEVGAMPPGAERTVELVVVPEQTGVSTPKAMITNDGRTLAEISAGVMVIDARLSLERTGPAGRFVGRPGEYKTVLRNESAQTLREITVQERVPDGLELANLPAGSRWDSRGRLLTWSIPELAAGETRELVSPFIASSAGHFTSILVAQDRAGNRAEVKSLVEIKGFADLSLDVSSQQRTVFVGEQVSLRLTLKNDGTAPARNVKAKFEVPSGLRLAAASPTQYQQRGGVIEFEPILELPVDGERKFDLVFAATQPGATKVSVQLESPDYDEPLIRDHAIRILTAGQ